MAAVAITACSDTTGSNRDRIQLQFEVKQINALVGDSVALTAVLRVDGNTVRDVDVHWATYQLIPVPSSPESGVSGPEQFWNHNLEPAITRTDLNGRARNVVVPATKGTHHVIASVGEAADTAFITTNFAPNPAGRLTWAVRPPMPLSRYYMAPASLRENIYIIGGSDADPLTTGAGSGSTLIYNPIIQTWNTGSPPVPPPPLPSTTQVTGAAASLDGRIHFLFGARHFSYNPEADVWSEHALLPIPLAEQTVPKRLEVVAGKLYAVTTLFVLAYDALADTWTLRRPMPTARSFAASAVLNGRIHVLGGQGPNGPLRTHERYDPATDQWDTLTPLPFPHASLATAVIGGSVCVFGGNANIWRGTGRSQESTWNFRETYCYEPTTNSWRLEPPFPHEHVTGVSAVEHAGAVYAFGGAKFVSEGFWQTTSLTAKLTLR